MDKEYEVFADMLTGKIDENKTYYTESMWQEELGLFAIFILGQEGILTKEKRKNYKKLFMTYRNKQLIEEMKQFG